MIVHKYDRFVVTYHGNDFQIFDPANHDEYHTHGIKSLKMAKTIIKNVVHRRKPHTKNGYLLESHIRLSDSNQYKRMVEHLQKKSKDKQNYHDKHVFIRR